MSNENLSRALTEVEASQYIGMSRSFLRQSRMEGNRVGRTPAPPFIKIGRSIRYLKDDLDMWLESFRKLTATQFEGGHHGNA